MQPVPRIFVSATSRDLRTARGLVAEGLRRMECLPIVQDDFPPDYKSVRDMLKTKISTCNAVVHLAGFYYGAEPQPVLPGPDRRSFTQMEYEIAMELKMPCYVFLCGENFPFDKHDPEPEEKRLLQIAHRERLLKRDELFYEFASPEELANRTRELQLSVENLRTELAKERNRRRFALAAAVLALLLSAVGGWWLFKGQKQQEVVIQKQGSDIAALKAQLEGPWFIVSKVNSTLETLAKSTPDAEEAKKLAIEIVAKEIGKSPADVEAAIASTTQLAEKLLIASRAEKGNAEENRALQIETLAKLASAHQAAGRYAEELKVCEERLALIDAKKQPAEWLEAKGDIAVAQRSLGRLADALKTWEAAFEFSRNKSGLPLDEFSVTWVNQQFINFLLYIEKDRPRAESIIRELLPEHEKELGKKHIETLRLKAQMAEILADQKHYEEAEEMALEAWNMAEEAFGKEAPETMEICTTAVSILWDLNELEDAIKLQRFILEVKEKEAGKDSEDTESERIDLSYMLRDNEEYDEAATILEAVLDAREKRLGVEHPDTLSVLDDVALLLSATEDYKGAEEMYRSILQIQEKTLGPEHPDTLGTIESISSQLYYQDDNEGSAELLRRVLKVREKSLGADHAQTIRTVWALSLRLTSQEKYKDAEPLKRRVLAAREKQLGPDAHEVAEASMDLAETLQSMNKIKEALPFAEKAVAIATDLLSKDDEDRIHYEEVLATLKNPAGEDEKPAETKAKPHRRSTITRADLNRRKGIVNDDSKAPPPPEEYADFRKDVNDRIKNEKWKEVTLDLPDATDEHEMYVTGWLEGKTLRKVMKVDSTSEKDGTYTFYYYSQDWLTSVVRVREGSDVPVEGVKTATDTYNFFNGEMVSWRRSQDDAEEMQNPEDPDFTKVAESVKEEAEAAAEPLLEKLKK